MVTCDTCGTENPGGARFCNGCGTALRPQAAVAREERKVVTVVFVDLVGSTARAERLDPEDVRLLLSSYHVRVRRVLEGHGGTVEKFIGDAVVAVFGAPVAHEDDPERAVRSALAIQEAIAELNESEPALELEVRIGVNTGEALVALEARPEAGEGMISGDVINTAARLQAAAPVGGILVGEQTHRSTTRAIEYEDAAPVDARGKALPVAAWRAVARRSSFGVEHDAIVGTPLIGREREVALLAEALARVRNDARPQLITLVGVPGIGKSRLVHELLGIVDADPDLITWRRGRSLPYGEGVAYWALGEIVKAQAGILESDDGEAASAKLATAVADLLPEHAEAAWVERQLRPLVGLSGTDGAPSRDEAFSARRRFLEALADVRPTVLVFEDLHWADDDLLDFIDELADRLDDVPLLLVCTARPELLARRPGWGGGKLNALTLSLAPLNDDETARLLHALLDRSVLPAETQAAIVRRSEGVPLFAEEYARMLGAGEAGPELPETLQGIVAARIDGLPPQDKALLQDASVLGKVFWTDALASLSGVGEADLEQRLRALQRQEFVRRERRSAVAGAMQYVFLHAIVRDVAYGQIPRGARSEKHRRTARWIAGLPADRAEDRADTLAHHLESAISYGEAAGSPVDDLRPLAVAALRDAGERAWALNSVNRAADFYRRAIAADPDHDPDPELRFLHAQAQMWAEGVEGEMPEFEAAIDGLLAVGKRELAAVAMVTLERRVWNAGRPDPTLLDRALELVSDVGATSTHAHVLATVAVRWAIGGRSEDALPLAEQAVVIARELGDAAGEAEALNTLSVVLHNLGEFDAALETSRAALQLGLESGSNDVTRCHINLATFYYEGGELRAAATTRREGLAHAKRMGNKSQVDWLVAELALDDYELGSWDEALAGGGRDWRSREARGTHHFLDAMLFLLEAGIVFGREGRLLRDLVARGIEVGREVGDAQVTFPALASAAHLLALGGVRTEADAHLEEFHGLTTSMTPYAITGPWTVEAALAWCALRSEPLPSVLTDGRSSTWTDATALISAGNDPGAADVLEEIGARRLEAEVRFQAAQRLHDAEPQEAARQLAGACAFWRTVGATARLAQADEVRAALAPAAS